MRKLFLFLIVLLLCSCEKYSYPWIKGCDYAIEHRVFTTQPRYNSNYTLSFKDKDGLWVVALYDTSYFYQYLLDSDDTVFIKFEKDDNLTYIQVETYVNGDLKQSQNVAYKFETYILLQ